MIRTAGRRSLVGFVAALALIASACGTSVSTRQARAEAREDVARAGIVGRAAANTLAGDATNGLTDVTTAGDTGAGGAGAGATGSGGAVGASGGPASAAGGSIGGAAAKAPSGGNGGATDVGITATEIRVGWVGTLTGPVPGLFRGALIGTQAYAAYLNSKGGLFGRRIRVLAGDDALDSGKNRAAHLQLKDKVFAFVGSFSVSDDGGASVLADCKCPDIGGGLSRARVALPNNITPQPSPDGWRTGTYKYYMSRFPADVFTHVAFFVSAIESARVIAANERKVLENLGMKIVYTREVQANEYSFNNDVIQMQSQGVKMLVWQGDVGNMGRMAKAIKDQGFTIPLANWGGAMYDENAFNIATAPALEGAFIDNVYAMFRGEDAARVPQVALMDTWMKKIDPNQSIDLFSLYGWLSARLFSEGMQKMGALAKRPALLTTLNTIGDWDADGIIAPVNIAKKKPADCFMTIKVTNGKYLREYPTDRPYACEWGGFQYTK
jgi:ABC-type branched-subunit amino acid transport system substrate-binding protein